MNGWIILAVNAVTIAAATTAFVRNQRRTKAALRQARARHREATALLARMNLAALKTERIRRNTWTKEQP
ncbi:hypothetical protein [Streptomyces reniochalinae]|uniref:Uncharacterized protein n=1 Tax=Streptomyces reniochalinae TaxID=2250578 RepID=A0A367EW28_9ACTN|nr:hypothetical protein [Streptomyces reniochalinae]RCG21785.1 hypothetical protein DQ392_08740 [Streptomyces reniochalinae]